ncbi:hypothetical protein IKF21_00800 [Candidatus Saccharibacteria bacterium]|nr:hypothetical protein [Candidatus Saccharibacteria bacterium]
MKKWNNNWEKQILKYMIGLLVFFSLFIALFAILGISEWASVVCAFMSVVTAIVLGTMTAIQNKRAEETNERLARINQEQLEASIINNNYPMIKFSELQRIDDDGNTFVVRFFDVRNVPLKEAYTRNIEWTPFEKKYKQLDGAEKSILRKKEIKDVLKFTYPHNGSNDGIYVIKIPVNNLFDGYRYARIELEMDLVSTTGVVTRSGAYVLMDRESKHKGMAGRQFLQVYDQSLEIREIMSEQKYNKKLNRITVD